MRRVIYCLLALVCLVLPLAGQAQAPSTSFPVGNAYTTIDNFTVAMTTNVQNAIQSGAASSAVNLFFVAMAAALGLWKFIGFALRGFDMLDLLELMFTISFVYILLIGYTKIFPAIFSAARYVGDVIGSGIVGTPPNGSFARSMMNQFAAMTFVPQCSGLDCLGKGIMAPIATVIGWIAVLLLGIIAVLVELWTIWGFQVAYAIGWVMIPFLLYERLQFLCDGWIKFLFGMAVYALVANANLALVFLSINLFLSAGASAPSGAGGGSVFHIDGLFDLAGLLVFVVIGIFALMSTGRFASAIVMGAGGGGIGGMVQSLAQAGASAASAGVGAIAGAVRR